MVRCLLLVAAAIVVHVLYLPWWIEVCRNVLRDTTLHLGLGMGLVAGSILSMPLIAGVLLTAQELRSLASVHARPAAAESWRISSGGALPRVCYPQPVSSAG